MKIGIIDLFTLAAAKKAAKKYTDTKASTKQDTLVSGTNIKTVNNESILVNGNIAINEGDINVLEGVQVNGTDLQIDESKKINIATQTPYNKDTNKFATMTDVNEEPKLIERIVVGYNLTISEPNDWETNYTDYYINSGTSITPEYTQVESEDDVPDWEENKYYSYTTVTSTEIKRTSTPSGEDYSFKEILLDIYGDNDGNNICDGMVIGDSSTDGAMNAYISSVASGSIASVRHQGSFYTISVGTNSTNGTSSGSSTATQTWRSNWRNGGTEHYDGTPISGFSIYSNVNIKGGVVIDVYGVKE